MTTIENTTKLMTTIQEEDIPEIKIKRGRGRPRIHPPEDANEDKLKRKQGRPKKYTPEELLEHKRACDKRRYDLNPAKKIQQNREYRQQLKLK